MIAKGQRGSGLLAVLMIILIATLLVAAMVVSQGDSVRRSGLLIGHDRAVELLLGYETWAGVLLKRDRAGNATDSLNEEWAAELAPVATEAGTISGRISDMQGRININNLVLADSEGKKRTRERLLRLFSLCEVDPLALVALEDWLDSDDEPRPLGAEREYYREEGILTMPANRYLDRVAELVHLRYLEQDGYDCLAPNLSALPVATPVNVNTATPMVLASLAGGVEVTDTADLVPEEGFATVADFLKLEIWQGRGLDRAGLAVASDFFLARGEAGNDFGSWALDSLIDRRHGITVWWRTMSRGPEKKKKENP